MISEGPARPRACLQYALNQRINADQGDPGTIKRDPPSKRHCCVRRRGLEKALLKHRRYSGYSAAVQLSVFRFPPDVIAMVVRWYLRYGSYQDVEELLAEGASPCYRAADGGVFLRS